MSGPTIKRAIKRASKIAVIDGLICLRISHSRTGQVAKAKTPAHASAGKKCRKIQIAARTKIVRSTTRPINCRDDCCIKNAASTSYIPVERALRKWIRLIILLESMPAERPADGISQPLWSGRKQRLHIRPSCHLRIRWFKALADFSLGNDSAREKKSLFQIFRPAQRNIEECVAEIGPLGSVLTTE